ncbi:MAG: hypothetical protein ACFE0I_08455 [Elainellaceae cyanobacterium]
MSQNLPIAPKAGKARDRVRSRCFLQCGYVGFRFVRYKCSPWFVLAIAPLTLLFATGVERTRVQIRWFSAIARIDFVRVYELLNDLLW